MLDEAERARRFVVCQADPGMTEWTRKCIAHADRLLLVAHASHSPELTAIEDALFDPSFGATLTHKELVLLHPDRRTPPTKTAGWLAPRRSYRHSHVSWEGGQDFNRLARLLSGNAVTLVLGGGGARGLCQIGAIRAIRESGTPIDAVGGRASARSSVRWLRSAGPTSASCSRASMRSSTISARRHDDSDVRDALAGARAPLEHYTATSTSKACGAVLLRIDQPAKSSSNVHHSGKLLHARCRQASRCRDSAWWSPAETIRGRRCIDNLPVGVMKRFIGGNTIAVESGVKVEYQVKVDDFPSPLQYLKTQWSRRDDTALPTLATLLIKSTLLGGVGGRHELREGDDLHLNPPMRPFGFLDWNAIYEMVDVGYRYTQERLLPWLEGNLRAAARRIAGASAGAHPRVTGGVAGAATCGVPSSASRRDGQPFCGGL
jgi:NTE family protein